MKIKIKIYIDGESKPIEMTSEMDKLTTENIKEWMANNLNADWNISSTDVGGLFAIRTKKVNRIEFAEVNHENNKN